MKRPQPDQTGATEESYVSSALRLHHQRLGNLRDGTRTAPTRVQESSRSYPRTAVSGDLVPLLFREREDDRAGDLRLARQHRAERARLERSRGPEQVPCATDRGRPSQG